MHSTVFGSVTIFILASKETYLLRDTIRELIATNDMNDIEKIVIVLKSDTCPAYYEAQQIIQNSAFAKTEMYVQKAATAELCIAELPCMVKSTHFVIMAADMEMHPHSVKDFIAKAKQHPDRIICAAKWLKGSVVEGYGTLHALGSRTMNTFISILFRKNVKDPFSLFQIYPMSVYKRMVFNSPADFIYEYTLKPLKAGVEYEEIPTVYRNRTDGKSNFNLYKLITVGIRFCLTAIRIRFSPIREIHEQEV